jgi:hypothetical protein
MVIEARPIAKIIAPAGQPHRKLHVFDRHLTAAHLQHGQDHHRDPLRLDESHDELIVKLPDLADRSAN